MERTNLFDESELLAGLGLNGAIGGLTTKESVTNTSTGGEPPRQESSRMDEGNEPDMEEIEFLDYTELDSVKKPGDGNFYTLPPLAKATVLTQRSLSDHQLTRNMVELFCKMKDLSINMTTFSQILELIKTQDVVYDRDTVDRALNFDGVIGTLQSGLKANRSASPLWLSSANFPKLMEYLNKSVHKYSLIDQGATLRVYFSDANSSYIDIKNGGSIVSNNLGHLLPHLSIITKEVSSVIEYVSTILGVFPHPIRKGQQFSNHPFAYDPNKLGFQGVSFTGLSTPLEIFGFALRALSTNDPQLFSFEESTGTNFGPAFMFSFIKKMSSSEQQWAEKFGIIHNSVNRLAFVSNARSKYSEIVKTKMASEDENIKNAAMALSNFFGPCQITQTRAFYHFIQLVYEVSFLFGCVYSDTISADRGPRSIYKECSEEDAISSPDKSYLQTADTLGNNINRYKRVFGKIPYDSSLTEICTPSYMRPAEYMATVKFNFSEQPAPHNLVICDSKFDFSSIPEARTVEKIFIPRTKEIHSTTSPSSQANSFVKIARQKNILSPTVLVIMHQIKQEDLHDCLRILGKQFDEIHYVIIGEADKLGKDSKFLFEPITKAQTFYNYNPLSADQYVLVSIKPVNLSSLFKFEVKYNKKDHTEALNNQIKSLVDQYQATTLVKIDSQTLSKIETLVNTALLKELRMIQNFDLFKRYSELLWEQLVAIISFFSNPGQKINENFENVARYEQALLAVIPRVAESNPVEEDWLKSFAIDTSELFKFSLKSDNSPSTSQVNPLQKEAVDTLRKDETSTSTLTSKNAHGNGNKRNINEVAGDLEGYDEEKNDDDVIATDEEAGSMSDELE